MPTPKKETSASRKKIYDIIEELSTKKITMKTIAAAFQKADNLPADEKTAAYDAAEKSMVDAFNDLAQNPHAGNGGELEDAQMLGQVIYHIAGAKGDALHPALKAFVDAASELTDRQYNTMVEIVRVALTAACKTDCAQTAADKLKTLTPNPFRKA